MAELFGIITASLGLLGVIDAAMSLGGTVIDYIKDFHDHNNAHQRLVSEVKLLQKLLPLVKKRLEDARTSNNSAYKTAAEALEAQDGPLFQYVLVLEWIRKELEKVRPGSTTSTPVIPASSSTSLPTESLAPPKPPGLLKRLSSRKSESSQPPSQASLVSTSTSVSPSASTTPKEASFRQRLTWPSTLDDIGKYLAIMGRFEATLNLILTAGTPDDIAKRLNPQFDLIREGIDTVGAKVEGVGNDVGVVAKNIENVGENVGELIFDMNDNRRREVAEWLSAARSFEPRFTATPGTGQWLIRTSDTFANWENGEFPVLFYPSPACTGKTTLMTIALGYLDAKYIEDPKRIAIRFHFDYQASADMKMADLLAYILKELLFHRALSTTMKKLLPYRRKPSARLSEAGILSLLCDEIRTYDRVYLVLDALDESRHDIAIKVRPLLIRVLPDNVSLLCTSRRIPEIMKTFADDQSLVNTARDEDLRKYIKAFFADSPRLCDLVARTNEVNQETVTSKVLERARGMFLLVRLTLQNLEAQETPNELKVALESLPSNLYKIYEDTIARSTIPKDTFRLLSWVFLAIRPVSPDELVHAMAWRLEATAPLDDQDLAGAGRLLSSCGGLVEIQKNRVVFIHYTMYEYMANLFNRKEHQSSLPPFSSSLLTHADIALLSLRYIACHLTKDTLTSPPPLLHYCVYNWPHHSFRSSENSRVNDAVFDFLKDTEKMELLNIFQRETKERSGLHLVAMGGLHLLIEKLFEYAPETLNAKDGRGRTPLHLAASNGHVKTVKVLLDKENVDVNAKEEGGSTPLHLAALNGHLETVKVLLGKENVDVNAKEEGGSTPLHFAASAGQLDIVKELVVTKDVDVNAKDEDDCSPLHAAVNEGDLDIVKVLLEVEFVNVNMKGEDGWTPLHLAAKGGHLDIVKVLLDVEGIEVNVTEEDGLTRLHVAVSDGNLETVKKLLGVEGVDVNEEEEEEGSST